MLSLPTGFLISIYILYYAIGGTTNPVVFLNTHSMIIVLLGTVAVLAIATPSHEIYNVFKSMLGLVKPEFSYTRVNRDLIAMGNNRMDQTAISHPLMIYAKELWEQGLDPDLFEELLMQKRMDLNHETETATASMRNLAKYPPALGMLGTCMGMVTLFADLASDKSSIGPNLAIAMTATFYGLLTANLIVMPLSDRLMVLHIAHCKLHEYVYHTLMFIHHNEPPAIIEGKVSHYEEK